MNSLEKIDWELDFIRRCPPPPFAQIQNNGNHVADSPWRERHRFGVRGHVRALKAATCRRTPKYSRQFISKRMSFESVTIFVPAILFWFAMLPHSLSAAARPFRLS